MDFRVIILIVATDPKNATTIPDRMAEAAHRLVVEAKDGFVKQLHVDPNVVAKSKALPFFSLLGHKRAKTKVPTSWLSKTEKQNCLKELASFSCLLIEVDEFKEMQDGGSKMADTKMAILSLIAEPGR